MIFDFVEDLVLEKKGGACARHAWQQALHDLVRFLCYNESLSFNKMDGSKNPNY